MAVITTTLGITSKAAGTSPASAEGPLSFALSLSATDTLTVDRAVSEIKAVGDNVTKILDGSALLGIDTDAGTPGTHGGFVYMKNITASDLDIYIGFNVAHDTTAATDDPNDADRAFTLKQGEFAFVPWDCTGDITARGEGACEIEYWFFNRG